MKKNHIIAVFIFLITILFFCIMVIMKQDEKLKNLQEELYSNKTITSELKEEINVLNIKTKIHPIEKAVQECMKKENYTTFGMSKCVDNSVTDWYKEIDKYLLLFEDRLPKNKYNLLKRSQSKWEDYKKSEWVALEAVLEGKTGLIYVNILSADKAAIVEKRAKDLHGLYFGLTD